MDIVNVYAFAEGYHSGATHEENVTITKESYLKIKDGIKNIKIYISDLDGKHSECEAEIGIKIFDEENQTDGMFEEPTCDGDQLYYELEDIFAKNGLDFKTEIKIVKEYEQAKRNQVDKDLTQRGNRIKLNPYVEKLIMLPWEINTAMYLILDVEIVETKISKYEYNSDRILYVVFDNGMKYGINNFNNEFFLSHEKALSKLKRKTMDVINSSKIYEVIPYEIKVLQYTGDNIKELNLFCNGNYFSKGCDESHCHFYDYEIVDVFIGDYIAIKENCSPRVYRKKYFKSSFRMKA